MGVRGICSIIALLCLASSAAMRVPTDTSQLFGRSRLRAFSEPVSDWYFVLKVYPPGYYTGSKFCTVDAPSDASSTAVTCTQKAPAHLHQFALVHSDSAAGPAKTGIPLLLVSRSFGVCGVQPDAPASAQRAHVAAASRSTAAEAAAVAGSVGDASVASPELTHALTRTGGSLNNDDPGAARKLLLTSSGGAAGSAQHPAAMRSAGVANDAGAAGALLRGAGGTAVASSGAAGGLQVGGETLHPGAVAAAAEGGPRLAGKKAVDPGFRPMSCATEGTLSTVQLWKVPGVADAAIDFDADWLYLSVDGQFCTLADAPANGTVGPAAKSVLSCHLAGALNAPQFMFSAVAFPFAGLNSLGAKGPCGALPAPDDSHDMVCGHPVAGEERQNVFSLVLQTPAASIASGASVGLFIFFDGLVGKALQQCCPMAGLSHMVQCSVLDADAPAREVPKACWYKVYKVGGKTRSEIADGDAVQIQSIAYSLYCSVSTDGALLCVSALPSNASRNVFRLHLPSHLPKPTPLLP